MTTPTLPDTSEAVFFVPGKPAPQGSKRHVGRGILVESSKEVGPWRERVALVAHGAMAGRPIFDGPVSVTLQFVLPRPKSAPKTRTPAATKRPDLDKLERAILDALTDVCFADDSQVVSLSGYKRIAELGETAGVEVRVEVMTPCQ
ncbi:RusA family crossover junction endodeoxyribonuclease [Mycobacteroides abscessus]|uniref:RusA family crossover junction endodeoxyribonuclease n=1 Tax=Mycobacteroides abscessus TaxID=36809 RepID=UPI00266DC717|nr:RusA family crossover junction endodeoxyribonuclease [Mycobacteroides abscessus]MDO3336388.1 RusA family crossover junction endodeoxyribonuclease [Mycobacteroides abscessus subsp. bolletii]